MTHLQRESPVTITKLLLYYENHGPLSNTGRPHRWGSERAASDIASRLRKILSDLNKGVAVTIIASHPEAANRLVDLLARQGIVPPAYANLPTAQQPVGHPQPAIASFTASIPSHPWQSTASAQSPSSAVDDESDVESLPGSDALGQNDQASDDNDDDRGFVDERRPHVEQAGETTGLRSGRIWRAGAKTKLQNEGARQTRGNKKRKRRRFESWKRKVNDKPTQMKTRTRRGSVWSRRIRICIGRTRHKLARLEA